MKLILKFNLVFIAIFLLGLARPATSRTSCCSNNAREEMLQNARLVMETALATRAYTSSQIGAAARDADEVQLPAAVGAVVLGAPRC